MISQEQNKGVSPVIGVILMVAITVIIAAVVANFVLNLGQQLDSDAEASFQIDQTVVDFGAQEYNVTISVSDMQTSDYLVVTSPDPNANYSSTLTGEGASPPPDGAPTSVENTQTVNTTDGGELGYRSGDRIIVSNVGGGETIQIYGGVSGDESLIQEYTVEDTLE